MTEVVHDCRRLSRLSVRYLDGRGWWVSVAAYDGMKPHVGEFLALEQDGTTALYRCAEVDHCKGAADPGLWVATAEFVPGKVARKLDLPPLDTSP